MIKKAKILSVFALILAGLMLTSVSGFAAQKNDYEQIPISIEGELLGDGKALLINEITYMPLRKLAETVRPDAKITYNDRTKTATVSYGDTKITVTTGLRYISVNGRYFYGKSPVQNVNGSLYVPIRPLAKALGLTLSGMRLLARLISYAKAGL
jgi:hypothetical protein